MKKLLYKLHALRQQQPVTNALFSRQKLVCNYRDDYYGDKVCIMNQQQ